MSRLDVDLGLLGILDINVVPERPTEPPEGPARVLCGGCDKWTAPDAITACENCGDVWCEECAPERPPYLADLMDITRMCRKACCVLRAAHREIHNLRKELDEQRSSTS